MKQSVHNKFSTNQNLRANAGFGNTPAPKGSTTVRKIFLTAVGAVLSLMAMAQTYTTVAAGNWTSAATWSGGIVPSTTISSGKIVNINHKVTFNLNSDLSISGKLSITGDTLQFGSSYDKKIIVGSTGTLNVKNGGFLQVVSSNKSEMNISGGRIILENAVMIISKNVKATAGTKRTYKNSTVLVGEKYEMEGTFFNRTIDTIANSYVEVGINSSDFEIKDYCTVRVANATVIAKKGKFRNGANSDITVLPNAAGNYGFDLLKVTEDLENDGAWNARIETYCVGKDIKGSNVSAIDFTAAEDCDEIVITGELPETSFTNPVLVSGQANKQGAVYRFANVTAGIDAEITLKKFSRNDIVMQSADLSGLGWEKAFQPQFGLPGVVAPYQNWYIDFELNFYKAGTNKKQKMSKIVFTALDVDGDGWSIAEYATFANPSSAEYSPVSLLGNGEVDILDPIADAGDLNTIVGTVQNFFNIDTAATQVMATFTYLNKDKITFRYGARSGAQSSNGSGIRLNSLWAKPFSLDPWTVLPVNFEAFSVMYDNKDAELNWKSNHGQELSHFVVQRSTDGKIFSDIATVFAGNTAGYSYKDKSVSSTTGVVYYRVMSVDRTKEIMYSTVKTIRLVKNDMQTLALTTYPNPVASEVRITLPAAWQGKSVSLQLYSANGIIAKSVQLGSAGQTEAMSVSNLASGMYVVKASCGNETAQQRIVKN